MSRARTTVRSLAQQADLELDEALVSLWDAGVSEVLDPDDSIPSRLVTTAQRALGITTSREMTLVRFWLDATGLDHEAFAARLATVDIDLSPRARRLPKNSLRRVRGLFPGVAPLSALTPRVAQAVEIPPLKWETVGTMKPQSYLSEQEVCAIHEALVEDFSDTEDPIFPAGLRDAGLLSSALARPQGVGAYKYPTVEMAGAAVVHSLVHNHPFHNGNKRTALVSLFSFLDSHGLVLTCDKDELFRQMLRLGQHSLIPLHFDQLSDREVLEMAQWIRSNVRQVDHGERPLKWMRLKQKLKAFDCKWEPAPGAGNRLNISRVVTTQGRFRPRREHLHVQVACAGDGTDADRNTVHEVRKQLHLDNSHGVDSIAFYDGALIDQFIIDYRSLLQRLGKF